MRRLKCEKETIILTNEDDGFYDVYTFGVKSHETTSRSTAYDKPLSQIISLMPQNGGAKNVFGNGMGSKHIILHFIIWLN